MNARKITTCYGLLTQGVTASIPRHEIKSPLSAIAEEFSTPSFYRALNSSRWKRAFEARMLLYLL
jgi:hypothetical protein